MLPVVKEPLKTELLINIIEYFLEGEQTRWQRVNKEFYNEIIPEILTKNEITGWISYKYMHYLVEEKERLVIHDIIRRR